MRETLCWLGENNVCCSYVNRVGGRAWLAGWRENGRAWKKLDKVVVQTPWSKIRSKNFQKKRKEEGKNVSSYGEAHHEIMGGWVMRQQRIDDEQRPMWFRSVDDREIGRMWRAVPCQGKLAEGGSKAKLNPKHKETGSPHPQWQQWQRYSSLEECQYTSEELPKSILFSLPADSFCNSLFWR